MLKFVGRTVFVKIGQNQNRPILGLFRPNQAVGLKNLQFSSIDQKVYGQANIQPKFQVILTNSSWDSRGGLYSPPPCYAYLLGPHAL